MNSNLQIIRNKIILKKIKKSKTVPVTGRGVLYDCEMLRIPHFLDSRLTNGSEAMSFTLRPLLNPGTFLVLIFARGWINSRAIVRCWGSHIFWTVVSWMTVSLWALRCGLFLPQEDSWYSALLEAGSIPGPWCGTMNNKILNIRNSEHLKLTWDG
jgi:hypothetical protein